MHLRKTNKKIKTIISNPLIPVEGWREPVQAARSSRRPSPWMGRPCIASSPPCPHSLRLGQYGHTSLPHMHLSGMWGAMESPQKTHSVTGRVCKLCADSGPRPELILLPHQHYNETTCNERTLFKDLLSMLLISIILKYWFIQ